MNRLLTSIKQSWLVVFITLILTLPQSQVIGQQANPVAAPPQDARQIDDQLAAEFFRNRDWENARSMYEKLWEKYKAQHYFNQYIECLFQLKSLDEAEKAIKKVQRQQNNIQNTIDLNYISMLKGERTKAEAGFAAIIETLPADRNLIHVTANAFRMRNLDDYALMVYEKGSRMESLNYGFDLERSYLYQMSGNYDAGMEAFLAYLEAFPEQIDMIKGRIQSLMFMDVNSSMTELIRQKILERAQLKPDKIIFGDLLIWFSLQEKDFEMAMNQARAIDRRFGDQDTKILDLSAICLANGEYSTALSGYDYLLKKGKNSAFYFNYLAGSIQARYQIEIQHLKPDIEKLKQLITDIHQVFDQAGFNRQTYQLAFIQASIQAFYLNQAKEADSLLEQTRILPLNEVELAEVKMLQADLLLFNDEIWEATLLYSQVDKAMKNEPLGHEARFRNARLRYFIGEFAWAQAQLEVLKAATSKLIANDALQLSLLISDALSEDTTGISLQAFATVDKLIWQKNTKAAAILLDSLSVNLNNLVLNPHILIKRAEILIQEKELLQADSLLMLVFSQYPEHYLADDALFRSAGIKEQLIGIQSEARKQYEIIFNNYPASIFASQARQKYRQLRGDNI